MFCNHKMLEKYLYNPVGPIQIDRAHQGLQDGILCFLFCVWPKIFLQAILSRTVLSQHFAYVCQYKVLEKYLYNLVGPIQIDRAHQGLQDGILCFLFCVWPKFFLQAILSRTVVSQHRTYVL